MKIISLKINNFRCFNNRSFNFDKDKDIVFITGNNGTGKTSILEAIHYSCYLKSFRTHLPLELIAFNSNTCSIDSVLYNSHYDYTDNINVNLNLLDLKRHAKLNQKNISSYKEIYNIFKIITLNSDDLKLIQDGPSFRRNFIDQTVTFTNNSYIKLISKYKRILENRNSLLFKDKLDIESYQIWSEKFFLISKNIQELRINIIKEILDNVKSISKLFNSNINLDINYKYHEPYLISDAKDFYQFQKTYPNLIYQESLRKKSLFGPHLDDIDIIFTDKLARNFSSRGEQKLVLTILKFAQIYLINKLSQNNILLIDDFFSDFDLKKIDIILSIIPNITTHTFITCPDLNIFSNHLKFNNLNFQIINL